MFATIGYYICIPFAWLLRALYELTSSYGWALVLFTVVIKLIMLPFQMKSKKSMMRMSRFQPMIKEIQTRYKNNQVKMNEELQRLYAEEGVNPMSGCLWSFLPFPILIALYSIIRQPITRFMMLTTTAMQGVIDAVSAAGFDLAAIAMTANDGAVTVKDGLTQLQPYGQITLVKAAQELGVALPEGWIHMDFSFLGMDLTMIPSDVIGQIGTGGWAVIGVLLIPIVSGALSFWQSKVSMAGNPSAADPNDPTARSSRRPGARARARPSLPSARDHRGWLANTNSVHSGSAWCRKYLFFRVLANACHGHREPPCPEPRHGRSVALRASTSA